MSLKLGQIFVNLPVNDLKRSMAFFTALGFAFNEQFTDEKAACLILGENMYAMLLVESFFQGFTKKPISDAQATNEVIVGLSAHSREQVDEIVHKALEAGGKNVVDPTDHGFMYEWGFADIDGHLWSLFYMDPSSLQG